MSCESSSPLVLVGGGGTDGNQAGQDSSSGAEEGGRAEAVLVLGGGIEHYLMQCSLYPAPHQQLSQNTLHKVHSAPTTSLLVMGGCPTIGSLGTVTGEWPSPKMTTHLHPVTSLHVRRLAHHQLGTHAIEGIIPVLTLFPLQLDHLKSQKPFDEMTVSYRIL